MKTALIIALVCLLVGALLIGIGWVLLEKYPIEQSNIKDMSYAYNADEVPQKINIKTIESRVEILPTEEEQWRVECKDTETLYHTVELVDGVLTIQQDGTTRKWYERIGILNAFQDLSVIVYLPAQTYESLNIDSTSGSIKVQKGFMFTNAKLDNTSGSILCASDVTGALNVTNTSGSITVSGDVKGKLDIQNSSGSITVSGSVDGDLHIKNTSGSITTSGGVNGKLDIHNGSGSITVKNATPISAIVKSTSGGIDLYDVVCQESCEISNTSGSIELERCDAASFDLKTVSGGIRASILSAKVFDCRSTSGSVRIPENGEGGAFKARSTSGGIRVEIVS